MNLKEKEILLTRLKDAQLELQSAIDAVNLSSNSTRFSVIDSNGKEIKIGSVVYGCSDGKMWKVIGFTTGAYPVMVEDEDGERRDLKAQWITQEKPNTQMDVEILIEGNALDLAVHGGCTKCVPIEVVKDALAMQREVTTRKYIK